MRFRPYDKKIEEVLGGKNRYEIPNFQRDYSWEERNYVDFIKDLLVSCEASIDKNNFNINIKDNQYFFGTLLVVGDSTNPSVEKPYKVVDGQQRLTTMTLFYAAISDLIKSKDENYAIDFQERLSFEDTNKGKLTSYSRLINRTLEPVLPVNILNLNNKKSNGAKHKAENSAQEWLEKSYKIIEGMLEKDSLFNLLYKKDMSNKKEKLSSKNISDESYILFLDNFGKFLSKSTVIIIYSEESKSANIIYRNFNSRGKPLTASDLIKNEIFSLLDDDSGSISSSWKEIEENVFCTKEKLNTFFYNYMIGNFSNGVTKNNLFDIFFKNVEKNDKSYLEFIEKLKKNSEFYKIIADPDKNPKLFGKENFFKIDSNPNVKRDLVFLNKIEVVQVRILLLAVFEAMFLEKINSKQFRKVINIIAKHQCLHVLTKSPANRLTSIYTKYSKEFRGIKKEGFASTIENLIKELKTKLPDRETVLTKDLFYDHTKSETSRNSKKKMKFTEKKDKALIRYILSTVSVENQNKNSERGNDGLSFIYNASLEHIIDQEQAEQTENKKSILSIGNIILLEQDLHKNEKEQEKKKEMYGKSKITFTNKFWNNHDEEFDSKKIQQRKKEILSKYYDIIVELK